MNKWLITGLLVALFIVMVFVYGEDTFFIWTLCNSLFQGAC